MSDHLHVWVLDGTYTDTPDARERCTVRGCEATRDVMPWQQREREQAEQDARRMERIVAELDPDDYAPPDADVIQRMHRKHYVDP